VKHLCFTSGAAILQEAGPGNIIVDFQLHDIRSDKQYARNGATSAVIE
jgi:hypothetical protein